MSYTRRNHTLFHHRYHIVWVPKYRYKVLRGKIRERVIPFSIHRMSVSMERL